MATCGLWLARSRVWSSIVDSDGKRLLSVAIARADDARRNFLSHLELHHGPDCALVVTDAQARTENLANLALQRNTTVWLVPWRTLDAVRRVAGLTAGPPRRTATALARMPLNPLFRAQLRRLQRDDRQLSML